MKAKLLLLLPVALLLGAGCVTRHQGGVGWDDEGPGYTAPQPPAGPAEYEYPSLNPVTP